MSGPQKHDNLFPTFNCTLSRVIQHSESQNSQRNKQQQQYSDFLSPLFGDTRPSAHFLTRRAVLNIAITVSTPSPAAAASVCGLESLNKWLPSCGHHHGAAIMWSLAPCPELARHVSMLCLVSNSKIENNQNIFFNNAPLKDSLWMINNAKLKVKQNNIIPELNPSLANIN